MDISNLYGKWKMVALTKSSKVTKSEKYFKEFTSGIKYELILNPDLTFSDRIETNIAKNVVNSTSGIWSFSGDILTIGSREYKLTRKSNSDLEFVNQKPGDCNLIEFTNNITMRLI